MVITIVLLASLVMPVYAQAPSTNAEPQGFIQMIVQKFGLDQTQVQAAVNQYKSDHQEERQQKMQTNLNNRLDTAVKNGKITASQKQAILDEIAALKSKYNLQSFKTMTADQRKQAMQNMKADIQAWAKAQNINPSYFRFGFGMHKGWINKSK